MSKKSFTENEVVLCTYIARFGRSLFNEEKISRIEPRSVDSVKMKVQNIAAMLHEEGLPYSDSVSCLSGKTTGKDGRRTNWDVVKTHAQSDRDTLKKICKKILLS